MTWPAAMPQHPSIPGPQFPLQSPVVLDPGGVYSLESHVYSRSCLLLIRPCPGVTLLSKCKVTSTG